MHNHFQGGFAMYVNPDTKVEDYRSTAWSFTIVGAAGIVLVVLLNLGILPFEFPADKNVMMTIVMGIMFLIFLLIGIRSFLSLRKLSDAAKAENSLDAEIKEWFLAEYTEVMKDESTEDETDEELYYPRYRKMSELILAKYPGLSEDFLDHVIEELYSELFPE
jgi:hypothetical protein